MLVVYTKWFSLFIYLYFIVVQILYKTSNN